MSLNLTIKNIDKIKQEIQSYPQDIKRIINNEFQAYGDKTKEMAQIVGGIVQQRVGWWQPIGHHGSGRRDIQSMTRQMFGDIGRWQCLGFRGRPGRFDRQHRHFRRGREQRQRVVHRSGGLPRRSPAHQDIGADRIEPAGIGNKKQWPSRGHQDVFNQGPD